MSAIPVEPGQSIDGFRVVSLLHRGGMATLWRVERAGAAFPLVMKVPHLAQGDDPVTVVSYEVEQTMLRALRAPPFENEPPITFAEIWRDHRTVLVAMTLAAALIVFIGELIRGERQVHVTWGRTPALWPSRRVQEAA